MAIKVYACMVVSRKTNKFLGFVLFKDWVHRPCSINGVIKRIDKHFNKTQKKRYGKIFVVERSAEDSAWL